MNTTAPHYLLIAEAKTISAPRDDGTAPSTRSGQWRFVLEQIGIEARIEVADEEPAVFGERLELLAVVRGLESLEQPSRVTLLTASRYVGRGIRTGIAQWRADDWQWERFGQLTPIKNHDLWRRIDHAMRFHSLECRIWDFHRFSKSKPSNPTTRTDQAHGQPVPAAPDRRTLLTPAVSRPAPSFGVSESRITVPSRTSPDVRRYNVIRPHSDARPTQRKAFAPTTFGADAHDFADVDEGSTTLVATADTGITSVAVRVKPPRCGRAYGHAPN